MLLVKVLKLMLKVFDMLLFFIRGKLSQMLDFGRVVADGKGSLRIFILIIVVGSPGGRSSAAHRQYRPGKGALKSLIETIVVQRHPRGWT